MADSGKNSKVEEWGYMGCMVSPERRTKTCHSRTAAHDWVLTDQERRKSQGIKALCAA
ncbi:hypothetical protein H6P81_007361 [Aristolochia fimbriata]|uniref:Uncharacterized protein n=1 Tax=Aristolochia fimbriata TaxID=158543 RepID=A0AAV7F3T6_ARIFI|nr:hypothetical protein H6P81_007361 [Aristolochia fimbriata]